MFYSEKNEQDKCKSSTQAIHVLSRSDGMYSVGTPELTPLRYRNMLMSDCCI